MTCIVPMAPADDVTFWRKLDSCMANANAKDGFTFMRRAVSATMVFSWATEGEDDGADAVAFGAVVGFPAILIFFPG